MLFIEQINFPTEQCNFTRHRICCQKNEIKSPHKQNITKVFTNQWWIQDFSDEGAPTPEGSVNLLFGKIFRKLHKNEEILGRRRGGGRRARHSR